MEKIGYRSPSAWHENARHRDAGHDAMQIGVWQWWATEWTKPWELPALRSDEPVRLYTGKAVHIEHPIVRDGKIISFADVAVEWFSLGRKHPQHLMLLEIKPKIDSVGAILRQLRAQTHMMQAQEQEWDDLWLVVGDGDPKTREMKQVWSRTLVWSGGRVCSC